MKKGSQKSFRFLILLIGFSTIIVQTVYIREFLTLFYGNEIVIGSFLGTWLLWTAIGSTWFARIIKIKKNALHQFLNIQIIWSMLSVATLFVIRSTPLLFKFSTGEITGYISILGIIFLTISPFCLLSGTLYTLACRLQLSSSSRPGLIYVLEAVGAVSGGLLLSFVLIPFMSPIQVLVFIFCLNLLSAITRLAKFKWAVIFTLIFTLLLIFYSETIENWTQNRLWPAQKTETIQTHYGNLTFTETNNQFNFFSNGLHLFSIPDPMTVESNIHLTLLQHKAPQDVLLIGGGLSGSLQEILKYQTIETIDYVELDPKLDQFVKEKLPHHLQPPESTKINAYFMDGRRFIQQTDKIYDVIWINAPNPYTLQLNRFYTVEFFKAIKKRLTSNGILSFSVPSSENAIGPELASYLNILKNTVEHIFETTILLPGETTRFIASSHSDYISSDANVLAKRIIKKQISTDYIRDYYLQFQLSPERIANFNKQLKNKQHTQLNKDYNPIAYYFDVMLWATYFSTPFKKIFIMLSKIPFTWILSIFIVGTICFFAIGKWRKDQHSPGVYAIYIVGFTEISIEFIYILVFQIYRGYAFHQIALIIAFYMTGLATGSFFALKKPSTIQNSYTRMQQIQGFMIFCLTLFISITHIISRENTTPFGQDCGLMILTLLLIANGFLGGYQFIVANHLYLNAKDSRRQGAGNLYGIDLSGSSVGIVFISLIMIPIYGIINSILLLLLINILALIFLQIFPIKK